MKYKIKFHCKQPRQSHIEGSPRILIPMIGTVQLIFGHCPFLSLCDNWPCVTEIFSFVRILWIVFLYVVLAHIPRNIFICNCTLDAKPFKILRCTCGRSKAFAKFRLKSYEDVLEISESFFKHHKVFPLTLALSNIFDRDTMTQQQDFDLVV